MKSLSLRELESLEQHQHATGLVGQGLKDSWIAHNFSIEDPELDGTRGSRAIPPGLSKGGLKEEPETYGDPVDRSIHPLPSSVTG